MPKCTMPKGGMPTDTVPRDGIREGSLSKLATKGTLQKGPNPKCTEPKGHVPKDVELKCNKPVDTMSHDGMPEECLLKDIAS